MTSNNETQNSEDWSYILFEKNPHLFLPVMEDLRKNTEKEVSSLLRIFDEFSVPPQGRILDLHCGIGRHSIALAERGYSVTGYDPSASYIQIARKEAEAKLSESSAIRFYSGSPSKLLSTLSKSEDNFDAIIVLFNSFGYRKDLDDFQTLSDLVQISADRSLIVLEIENRDYTLKNFQQNVDRIYDRIEIHQTWRFDFEDSVSIGESKFYEIVPGTGDLCLLLQLTMRLRLYSLHEIKNLLKSTGWRYIKSYGTLIDLDPFSLDSSDYIVVGTKES